MIESIKLEKLKKINWIGILSVLIILLGIFWFYKKNSSKTNLKNQNEKISQNRIFIPPDVLKSHKIEITRLRERGFSEKIVLPGKVSFDLERLAKIGSRVPGRVSKVYVKEGDMVNTGQPLASISSVELGNAQANYLKSRARLEVLRAQSERAKNLYEEKIISAKEYEFTNVEFQNIKTELETNLNSLKMYGLSQDEISQLELGKLSSSFLTIRSPIGGTVTLRNAINGQSVTTEDNLFEVADLSKLWILLDVYEKDLYSVKLEAEANVFILGEREEEEEEKKEVVKAKVKHVSEVIDPVKHTAEIRLEVDNRNSKLKPGQTVSAHVEGLKSIDKTKKIMVVPSECIHKIEGKSYVFVQHLDGSFEAKKVETGETIDDDTEIKSGITTDETIAKENSFLIKSEFLK